MPALMQAAAAAGRSEKRLVAADQQAQPAAVGAQDAVETPLANDDLLQHRMDVRGRAVDGVVGGHHGARAALAHGHLERLRVVLAPQPLVEVRRGVLARVLVAVRQEVLQERGRLPVAWVVALQTPSERDGQRASVEGVLAVDLLGAAPARVAREVGVRRAYDQAGPLVLPALVEIARLLGLLGRDPPDELGIPRRAEAVGLRELRRRGGIAAAPVARPALRDTVVALDVRRADDAEPWHRRAHCESVDLLGQGHAPDQVADPFLDRQVGVLEGILRGGRLCGGGQRGQPEQRDEGGAARPPNATASARGRSSRVRVPHECEHYHRLR